jgi:hypothetical protein
MKEIVSLKKILNNETVLQIHVSFMPRNGIVACHFVNNNDSPNRFGDKKYREGKAANGALYEPRL